MGRWYTSLWCNYGYRNISTVQKTINRNETLIVSKLKLTFNSKIAHFCHRQTKNDKALHAQRFKA